MQTVWKEMSTEDSSTETDGRKAVMNWFLTFSYKTKQNYSGQANR